MRALEPATDEDLVRAAQRGCERSFDALVARHRAAIEGYARSRTRNTHDAADVTQATFLVASQRLHQLRSPESFRPWIFTIARNAATRQALQRDRVRPVADLGVQISRTSQDCDDLIELEGLRATLAAALPALTDRYRLVVAHLLRPDPRGLDEVLGVSKHTAAMVGQRAGQRLREAIEGLLLARDPSGCPTLARELERWDGRYTRPLHRRITSHVRHCDTCGEHSVGVAQVQAA